MYKDLRNDFLILIKIITFQLCTKYVEYQVYIKVLAEYLDT